MPPTPLLLAAIGCLVAIGPLPARASTAAAWSAHQQEVTAACIAASGLVDAQLVGSLIVFDDALGSSAALVAGRYPQAHMGGQTGLSLCLFDRRSRTAKAAPADDWR